MAVGLAGKDASEINQASLHMRHCTGSICRVAKYLCVGKGRTERSKQKREAASPKNTEGRWHRVATTHHQRRGASQQTQQNSPRSFWVPLSCVGRSVESGTAIFVVLKPMSRPMLCSTFEEPARQTTAPLACRELGQSRCARGVERLHNPKVMSLSRARNTLCEPEYTPCRFLLGVATG